MGSEYFYRELSFAQRKMRQRYISRPGMYSDPIWAYCAVLQGLNQPLPRNA
mgnify:CR=1|jgi:hypothetical protein